VLTSELNAVAETHVHRYYKALESSRSTIASYFMPQTTMPDGKLLPTISFNGTVMSTGDGLQKLFEDEMPPAQYDIQSYDCQVLNPNYAAIGTKATSGSNGRNMTVLMVVSGTVKLGTQKESETKGFSDTFVLVPNPDAAAAKARKKPLKEWLVQSQTFRLVV
jgi:NTF2-related export protein 1/2